MNTNNLPTAQDFDKLVETFGFEHPLVTFVWNKWHELGDAHPWTWGDEFEKIYHKYQK